MKSIILTIILVITLVRSTYTPCPDGSACPEGILCCDAGEYYSCCRKEFVCCYDGLKCCKNTNHFMKIVFRNDIIENSTKSIYKKDTFEQLFLKIINSLNFYHYFPNLNQCEKFVKQLMSDFIEKMKRLKNSNDIYHFIDIFINEINILKPQIIEKMNQYCFNIKTGIKNKI